jgi:hypothetical protein
MNFLGQPILQLCICMPFFILHFVFFFAYGSVPRGDHIPTDSDYPPAIPQHKSTFNINLSSKEQVITIVWSAKAILKH